MNFSILTPPPSPLTEVHLFGGLGVGGGWWGLGQNFFACCGCCMWISTWVLDNFFRVIDPLTHGGVLSPNSGYPGFSPPLWALASGKLAVFALVRLFSGA